ncbi:hypothetical protein CLHUN_02820 [Ruminiclostridium hungatei]|uniref:Uncharacterized protein n=1 Tax=Ruminiclostridium hungatei TaxID=48256 RepID=A0A1V4SRP9_RUMHU|nr:hypothetical protein [Ruminiclostridium hungatei]OPX46463.1 hypothetical protein CLHUN_02820 [Ruminiclostridium hungatei]
MNSKTRQYKFKFIALILAAVVLITSVPLAFWGFGKKDANAMNSASQEDKRIATEISNETGFSVEEVFNYKIAGRSWSQVLDILRTTSRLTDAGGKSDKNSVLLSNGLDDEFISKLKKEGFSQQQIIDAKMLAERVALQLQDIASYNARTQAKPAEAPGADNNESNKDKIEAYAELAKKIDYKNAIYFMLKLKSDFGSYESALDEYLCSLQLELDMEEYIKDKKAYLDKKEDKSLLLNGKEIITLRKIEEKNIEILQKDNMEVQSEIFPSLDKKAGEQHAAQDSRNPLPDVPQADAGAVKPKNPTAEVMDEINKINPVGK